MSRVALKWNVLNQVCFGTLHQPEAGSNFDHQDLAVLILNSGWAPRAGISDLSVRIGDALAKIGIPVFRFDPPGLGDTHGTVPVTGKQYWSEVLSGRNDEFAWHLIGMIRERLGIQRIILGGLCAAIVPAVRIASRENSHVVGTIVLEPDFSLPGPISTGSAFSSIQAWTRRTIRMTRKSVSIHEWLHLMEKRGNTIFHPMARKLSRFLDGDRGMPTDTNLSLVKDWRNQLSKGIGSLVIIADDARSRLYVCSIIDAFPQHYKKNVCLMMAPDSSHTLKYAGASNYISSSIVDWIARFDGCSSATDN